MFQCYMHSFPQLPLLTHIEILPKENGVFLNVCNAELFANMKKKLYFKKGNPFTGATHSVKCHEVA